MNIQQHTLSNGIRLVTIPMADNPAATVFVMVAAGSKYETDTQRGISHFLEHMVFKGTTKRSTALAISRELDGIGADYNAFTGQEYTGYHAKASAEKLPLTLDVIADMYLNPTFPAAEMEKEKGVIVEEIRMYRDLPQRHVHDVFMDLVYGDNQPAGRSIAGTEESVKGFKREDFLAYRTAHYVAEATIVIVSGTFDEKNIVQSIEEKFASIPRSTKSDKVAVIDVQTKPAIRIEKRTTDQTHLVLGVRSFAVGHEDVPVLKLLSGVLGTGMSSRLTAKLREEMGVCYYVYSSNDLYTDHGLFTIAAGVDKARVHEVVGVLRQEMRRLTEELVPIEELTKSRDYLTGTMLLGLETSDSRAEFAGFQLLLRNKIETPDMIKASYMKVTPEDLRRVAQKIFVTEHMNLALVGNVEDEAGLYKLL